MLFNKCSYINSLSLKAKKLNNKFYINCFFALVLLTPSLFVFGFTDVFEYPKIFAISVVLSLISIFLIIKTKKIILSKFDLLFILGLVFVFFNSFFSTDIYSSFFGYFENPSESLLFYTSCIVFFIIFKKELTSFRYTKIFDLIIYSSLLPVFYSLLQIFNKDIFLWESADTRVFSTFGQPNFFSMYLVVVLGALISKIIKKFNGTLFLYFLIVFFSFYNTFSISGVLTFIIYLTLLIFFHYKNIKLKFALIFVLTVSILIIFFTPLGSRVLLQVKNISNGNNVSINDTARIRLILWKSSVEQALQFPYFFIGRGYGNFAYSYARDKELNNTSEWSLIFNRPHNYFIEKLFNGGVFVFCFYVYLLFLSFKNFKNNYNSFIPFVLLVFSLFLWLPSYLYFLLIFFIFKDTNFKNFYSIKSLYFLIPVSIVLIVTLYYGVSNFVYNYNPCFSSKMFLHSYQQYFFKCSLLNNNAQGVYSAYKINPKNKIIVEKSALFFLNTKNDSYARQVIFNAYNLDPHFPIYMYYKGLYNELLGDYNEALNYYIKAQKSSHNFYQNNSAISRLSK